jgi:hypothetical protein
LQASVIVYDEVNCKIDGLELKTRKRLVEKFKFEIPGVRYTPAVRLGRWDGKVSFFQLSSTTYINLLPEILPILSEEGYDIHLRDLRTYTTDFKFDEFHQDTFADSVWPKGHVAEGQPIKFRDYQVEIINNFLRNPQSVQIVATGAGKTIMTAALSKSVEKYGRSIVIVPNKSLVTQTEADYINLGLNVGVFFGDRKEFGRTHTICTWQSLNNLMKGSKEGEADIPVGEFIDGVICVMVDECFSGDMKVLTPSGYVCIKDIKPGDTVINYSEETKQFKIDLVIKQHINLTTTSNEKMYELEFDNGKKICVTGNHKFLTNDGWIRADELTENHEIVNIS